MAEPSYAHGACDVALLGDTIGGALERTAAHRPDAAALVSCAQGIRLTYAELDAGVDRVATGLLERGIAAGDRVGIWAPNAAEWVLVQYATAKVGAILVNVNPAYRTHELAYALRQSGVRLLVSARAHRGSDYGAMIDAVRRELPALEEVVLLEGPGWEALAATAPDRGAIAARGATLDPDDPINIQYTSGTTGFPKGATLTHHNILNNGFSVGALCAIGPGDRICLPVPFYHCFGMVMGNLAAVSHGACVVIPAPAFEPAATLRAVAAERCTALYGVPTMFIAMLADPSFAEHDLASLRTGIMAGSPCPSEVMRRVVGEMHMAEVSICYGMTKTSPVSTQTRVDDPLERRVGTVGRVGPHVEVKVVDPTSGLTLARGETGELCTRGYSVMLGYWDEPEQTAEAIDRAGWMHTGDLATMDAEGYVSIVGRSKDLVIRGGENVYPREVEEFLYAHPDVEDAQVVGVPDERYGEELCAWLRLRAGADALDADALRAFCAGRLAHFKVPRYVLCVDAFPMTGPGRSARRRCASAPLRCLLSRASPRCPRSSPRRLSSRLPRHRASPRRHPVAARKSWRLTVPSWGRRLANGATRSKSSSASRASVETPRANARIAASDSTGARACAAAGRPVRCRARPRRTARSQPSGYGRRRHRSARGAASTPAARSAGGAPRRCPRGRLEARRPWSRDRGSPTPGTRRSGPRGPVLPTSRVRPG